MPTDGRETGTQIKEDDVNSPQIGNAADREGCPVAGWGDRVHELFKRRADHRLTDNIDRDGFV